MLEIVEKFLKLNLVLRPEFFQQNFRKQIQLCVSGAHLYLLHFVNRICLKFN